MQSTSLCADSSRTEGNLLWGQPSSSTHLLHARTSPEAQTAPLWLSPTLTRQQQMLHLTQCLACHYLEMEIRGCSTLQQILFPLCPWSPAERACFLVSHLPWRHRVCTGRALTLGRTSPILSWFLCSWCLWYLLPSPACLLTGRTIYRSIQQYRYYGVEAVHKRPSKAQTWEAGGTG